MSGILEFIRSVQFLSGLGAGFGFWLLVLIIRMICKASSAKYVKQLVIEDEHGKFTITLDALTSFLNFVLKEFPALTLDSVKLPMTEDGGVTLCMRVKFVLGGNVQETKNALYSRIESDMKNQLAIGDQIRRIDISVVEFVEKKAESQES